MVVRGFMMFRVRVLIFSVVILLCVKKIVWSRRVKKVGYMMWCVLIISVRMGVR